MGKAQSEHLKMLKLHGKRLRREEGPEPVVLSWKALLILIMR